MILGVDLGYYAVKTSEGVIFPSKVTTKEQILKNDSIEVEYNGIKYTVGEGSGTVDFNKIDSEITKILLFAAIALSTTDPFNKIVSGLPIAQFKTQKEQFKKFLIESKGQIKLNGEKRSIFIEDAEIFPQSAAALFAENIPGEALILDIGGRTIDISLFDYINGKRKLTKYSTIWAGMISLYSKVIEAINTKFDLDYKNDQGEKILKKGLFIYGQKQDTSFLKKIISEHIEEILQELILNYPIKTTPIYMTGGGAYLLGDIIKLRIPGAQILNNAQFNNANGFKKVGVELWQQKKY